MPVLCEASHHLPCACLSQIRFVLIRTCENPDDCGMFASASQNVGKQDHPQKFRRIYIRLNIKVRRREYGKQLYGFNYSSVRQNVFAAIGLSTAKKAYSVFGGMGRLLQ